MYPPKSLLYISQAVRKAGHEAEVVDITPESEVINDDVQDAKK